MPKNQDFFATSTSYGGGGTVSRDKYLQHEAKLSEAIEKLKEQDAFIKQVSAQPAIPGIIVERHDPLADGHAPSASVIFNGSMVRLPIMDPKLFDLKSGEFVLVVGSGGIMARIDEPVQTGRVVAVKQILPDLKAEISLGGESAVVRNVKCLPLKGGDRVTIDQTNTIILDIVPAPPAPTRTAEVERWTWDDVVVPDIVKREIEKTIVRPVTHGHIVSAYGRKPSAGILFWGPPGCGKTTVAKVVATLIAKDGKQGFFSVKGPELMNPFVGETERLIRELFGAARQHKMDTGQRAVVFIDEADSCLGRRGRHLHSDISVPAFLAEMDGVDANNQPLVILATNRPFDLDEAVVRDGRVDTRLEIKRPEVEEVRQLFNIYLAKSVCAGSLEETANAAVDMLQRGPLWNDRSGALVASLVGKCIDAAIDRDVESLEGEVTGISLNDVREAILEHAQNHQI